MKIRLGVIFGGKSGEHEISLMSAASVIRAIDKEKYHIIPIGIDKNGLWYLFDGSPDEIEDASWERKAKEALKREPEKYGFSVLGSAGKSLKDIIDFALPILHGPYGEDGTIQGLFEMIDIPYGGSNLVGAALSMDKIFAKELFEKAKIPQGPYLAFTEPDRPVKDLSLKYPLFVKPANLGSSVGISKVTNQEELERAVEIALEFDSRILIEEGIDCRELEVAVLGNDQPLASLVGEIIPSKDFYDYEAKYLDGGASELIIPAPIDDDLADEIRAIALKAYRQLNIEGYARVDFFLERETGKIYLNEINSIPGFTKFSMFPLLWEETGLPYSKLIERIIQLGYERYNVKNSRKTSLR